ncbi:MAG: UDP-N-acetylmuramate--L-alanine ligase [Sphingomonadales bacterium]
MKRQPQDVGIIHFVGIGGIGMSGIAELLCNLGYGVQGSDIAANANVRRLEGLGVPVHIGHDAAHLGNAQVVVVSSAVKASNPEVMAARERKIPVVRRAEMLAELMRLKSCVSVAGTHGKTTTTSMVAAVLDAAGLDPTVINGGIINAYGTNAHLGAGEWMVVEADESDGTFVKLPATIAVVTNIDPEHLDFYGDFDAIKAAFRHFVEAVPFYGAAVMCIDHADVQALIAGTIDRRVVSYGFSPQADVRAVAVETINGGCRFMVDVTDGRVGGPRQIGPIALPMPGRHNIQNACAAIAVGLELGVEDRQLIDAFARFAGVKRRFSRVGEVDGVTIIDDYGHHPVEIRAVLAAARATSQGRVIAVVQPHRYSRLAALFNDFCTAFNDADTVVVADVYAAGESPVAGADKEHLVAGLKAHGHRRAIALADKAALADVIAEEAAAGDYVICLGAGDITAWANALPEALARAQAGRRRA